MSNLAEMLGNFAYNVGNNGFRGYPTESSARGSSKTIILVIVIILIIIGGAIAIYFATEPKDTPSTNTSIPMQVSCIGLGPWDGKTATPGNSISRSCPDGSNVTAMCNADGSWSNVGECPELKLETKAVPQLKGGPVDSKPIVSSPNAPITCIGLGPWEGKTSTPGNSISRSCPDGSNVTAMCNADGSWSNVGECPVVKPPVVAPGPPRTQIPVPPVVTLTAPPPPPDLSSFKPQIHQKSGNCLDSNGKEVYIGTCNAGAFQKWNHIDNTIQHSSGKCLDSDGKTVYASDCNKTQFQSWTKEGNNYKHGQSGLCLDSDGSRLYLSDCGATNEFQKWGNTASTVSSLIGNTASIGGSLSAIAANTAAQQAALQEQQRVAAVNSAAQEAARIAAINAAAQETARRQQLAADETARQQAARQLQEQQLAAQQALAERNICKSTPTTGRCNDTLTSQKCILKMQPDGNLVVYSGSIAVWSSGTNNKGVGPYRFVMQDDGNLVLYDSRNSALWASGTNGKGPGPYTAKMQDDCNFVVYDRNQSALWSSGTMGR